MSIIERRDIDVFHASAHLRQWLAIEQSDHDEALGVISTESCNTAAEAGLVSVELEPVTMESLGRL